MSCTRNIFAALAVVAGCSSSTTPPTTTADAGGGSTSSHAKEAGASSCGNPGDKGNALGVGKYCQSNKDCLDNGDSALCSKVGDPTTFFCTKLCDTAKDVTAQCGSDATCACGTGGCGCTPKVCTD